MSPSEHHPEWGRQRAAELGSHLQACPLGTCLHAAGPGLCPWHLRPHLGSGREVGREEAGRVPTTVRGKEEHRPGRPERGLEKPQLGCRTAPSAGEVPRQRLSSCYQGDSLRRGQQLARVSRKLVWL